MARWENEDVSHLNLPEPEIEEFKFYGLQGLVVHDDNKALAMTVESTNSSTKYYIKFTRGELVDPYTVDSNFKVNKNIKYKKVSEKSFTEYLRYLKTKNRLYFTKSRRLAMEN